MNIAIVDDNETDSLKLYNLCNKWGIENYIDISIKAFNSGENFLESYAHQSIDLIFLDIYMKKLSGIETARIIRNTNHTCLIVFLTSSLEHTWDAFPLHPFDYVVKPYKNIKINQILNEALLTLPTVNKFIEVTVNRQKIAVIFSDICYIQSENHHVIIYKENNEILKAYSKFQDVYNELIIDKRFLLCNRGIMINMDSVIKYNNNSFTLKNGSTIPIRLRDAQDIYNTFTRYQFERLRNKNNRR